mmetsp:Transcript_41989/g.104467  ORF Transcript_41989/g.104467 Transcript_41989/m.104467 type:complete len:94 (-) Transcript_41989:120-401(-)
MRLEVTQGEQGSRLHESSPPRHVLPSNLTYHESVRVVFNLGSSVIARMRQVLCLPSAMRIQGYFRAPQEVRMRSTVALSMLDSTPARRGLAET